MWLRTHASALNSIDRQVMRLMPAGEGNGFETFSEWRIREYETDAKSIYDAACDKLWKAQRENPEVKKAIEEDIFAQ
jgi:hypothetical protein